MVRIEFSGCEFLLQPGESVLDCLLREGVTIPHSCKAGACQSCMLRTTAGSAPERAQEGLKDTLRAQGYFLACCCHPTESLKVSPPDDEQRLPARIMRLERLSDTVLRVSLRPFRPMEYRPGQFLSLVRDDGLARSYSVASLPSEPEIELHVRRVPNGAMSGWIFSGAALNATVRLQGPAGSCFYVGDDPEQPIVCIGAGTGLAPLYGIVRDALAQGHRGPVWLFHAALDSRGLYLVNNLLELSRNHSNFTYAPSVLQGDDGSDARVGPVDEYVTAAIPNLKNWKGYVCGDPSFVSSLRMKLFLAGMASKAIYADAFVPSAPS